MIFRYYVIMMPVRLPTAMAGQFLNCAAFIKNYCAEGIYGEYTDNVLLKVNIKLLIVKIMAIFSLYDIIQVFLLCIFYIIFD